MIRFFFLAISVFLPQIHILLLSFSHTFALSSPFAYSLSYFTAFFHSRGKQTFLLIQTFFFTFTTLTISLPFFHIFSRPLSTYLSFSHFFYFFFFQPLLTPYDFLLFVFSFSRQVFRTITYFDHFFSSPGGFSCCGGLQGTEAKRQLKRLQKITAAGKRIEIITPRWDSVNEQAGTISARGSATANKTLRPFFFVRY